MLCLKAPKIDSLMSWMVWEEQTCDQIDRLYRAIGSLVIKTSIVKSSQVGAGLSIITIFFIRCL